MRMIDTHAHLFLEDFDNDLEDVVAAARAAGVEKILLPNIDESTVAALKQTTAKYPGLFVPMMGLHPTHVTAGWQTQLETIYRELNRGGYIAVGEIGIDLHWDRSLQSEQTAAFERQLQWSAEMDLPVSIHSRDALREVIQSVRLVGQESLRGVFHSFGGTPEELQQLLMLDNFFIGINGVVTYKNSGLAQTLQHCPADRIVIETDAPFLAPVRRRGKRNEPALLSEVVATLARIYGLKADEMAAITTRNARRLFRLEH